MVELEVPGCRPEHEAAQSPSRRAERPTRGEAAGSHLGRNSAAGRRAPAARAGAPEAGRGAAGTTGRSAAAEHLIELLAGLFPFGVAQGAVAVLVETRERRGHKARRGRRHTAAGAERAGSGRPATEAGPRRDRFTGQYVSRPDGEHAHEQWESDSKPIVSASMPPCHISPAPSGRRTPKSKRTAASGSNAANPEGTGRARPCPSVPAVPLPHHPKHHGMIDDAQQHRRGPHAIQGVETLFLGRSSHGPSPLRFGVNAPARPTDGPSNIILLVWKWRRRAGRSAAMPVPAASRPVHS